VPVAGPLPVSGGVFQVVKTASSRGRTGRTLLRLLFLLSTGAHGGAGMLRTGVIRRFRVTFTVATPKSSRRHALMLSRWLAAVHELRAPVQGQNRAVVKAALTCGFLTSIVVRVFGRFQKRKEFFGNHGGALSLHHRASSPSVPGISAPGNSARKSVTGALRFT
jgi:hypothetical protein